MEPGAQAELVERFFAGTGESYRRTATLGTLGADPWWKRQLLAAVPADALRVVDQASGTGILTFSIARRFPRSRVVGVELRREYAALAQREKERLGIGNVDFLQGRAEEVVVRPPVDCVASSYLAKYADLRPLVANAAWMLRPGGVIALHDFTYPSAPLPAAGWALYLRLLRAVWGRLHPEWGEALAGLPGLLRATTWVPDLARELREHGFEDIRVRSLTFGSAALVTARRGGLPPGGRAGGSPGARG